MTPLCSSKFSVGKPPDEALALSQFLTRTILQYVLGMGLLRGGTLTLVAAQEWHVGRDAVGDCAWQSGVGAESGCCLLRPRWECRRRCVVVVVWRLAICAVAEADLRRTQWRGHSGSWCASCPAPRFACLTWLSLCADEATSLKLAHSLASLTVAVASGKLVVDPTADVERVASCKLTVVYSSAGKVEGTAAVRGFLQNTDGGVRVQLCGVYKPGRAAVSLKTLKAAQSLCRQRQKVLLPLFEKHAATLAASTS